MLILILADRLHRVPRLSSPALHFAASLYRHITPLHVAYMATPSVALAVLRAQPGCSTSSSSTASAASARRALPLAAVQWRRGGGMPLQQHRPRLALARPPALQVVFAQAGVHADYQAKATDDAVLRRPLKMELRPEEITSVFGYPRDLAEK